MPEMQAQGGMINPTLHPRLEKGCLGCEQSPGWHAVQEGKCRSCIACPENCSWNDQRNTKRTWMDPEAIIQSEVSQKKTTIAFMWNLENWYRWSYLQSRNRDTDAGNKCMDTEWGVGGGGRNWEIGIDIYAPLCIKQITEENLLYSTGKATQCSVVT